jgi:peptide/nickel transport system substrate-binding protein
MRQPAALLATIVAAVIVAVPVAARDRGDEGRERTVVRIGILGEWGTQGPAAAPSLPDREIWNLQYATLTGRDAPDLLTEPALAEDWTTSQDRLTTTYTLREGLRWSDGRPLTADDVVWTITTAREQQWPAYQAVQHLEAEALDERTLRITSSVPDARLPALDVWLVPRHVWEPVAVDLEAALAYQAQDGVGSGPFTVAGRDATTVRLAANPEFWGWDAGGPVVDQVELIAFPSGEELVDALEQGRLDGVHGVSPESFDELAGVGSVESLSGDQGRFDALVFNGGANGAGPNPAVQDPEVRRAVAEAIDRDALVAELWAGLTQPLDLVVPAPEDAWRITMREEGRYAHDPAAAQQRLDAAGYRDDDGDAVRESPSGDPLTLLLIVDDGDDVADVVAERLVTWLGDVGVGVERRNVPDVDTVVAAGDFDVALTSWLPAADPDHVMSSFASVEAGGRDIANWSDPGYDDLYARSAAERDIVMRRRVVWAGTRYIHEAAITIPLYVTPDLQAHRTDGFEGWLRQPGRTGPVLMAPTSPTYTRLRPAGVPLDDGSGMDWPLIAAAGSALLIGGFLGYRRVRMWRERARAG